MMEACGGANHWYRELMKLGHEVKLIAPQFVKPFVKGNKNDKQDARAIAEAASRPEMRFVNPKSLEQQNWQSLLRSREGCVEMRTKLCNQIRGLLAEYGVVVPKGVNKLRSCLPGLFDRGEGSELPNSFKELLENQYNLLLVLSEQIAGYDLALSRVAKGSDVCCRLMTIPGVGEISSVALVSAIGEGKAFKNGRHFAAFIGLVPRQHSSGGKQQLLGISKRGDGYLRRLLVHGARAAQRHSGKKVDKCSVWVNSLAERMHKNKACVALANKNARIALALLQSGESYKAALA